MRALQGLGSAIVVSSVFCLFLVGLLGATLPFAIGSGVVLGLGIVAVVATKSTAKDAAADVAWRKAAPDLPPASDRRATDAARGAMPGPQPRQTGQRTARAGAIGTAGTAGTAETAGSRRRGRPGKAEEGAVR